MMSRLRIGAEACPSDAKYISVLQRQSASGPRADSLLLDSATHESVN
jgi:hypothetical protein